MSAIITPEDFGAVGDGQTDDTSALQAAINQASTEGLPLILGGNTYLVKSPLNLKGRYLVMQGTPSRTMIKAGAAMSYILDIGETTEVASYSPLVLSGVGLDGNNLVSNANIYVRYRRQYCIENMLSVNAPRGLRIKDGNSGVLRLVRTSGVQIGLHSEGSNHQTHHDACAFNGASNVGLLVEANGTGNDGSYGLTFTGCLVESGIGEGIRIEANTQVDWNGGYIGEFLSGTCINNRGGTFEMRGGVVFFGSTANHTVVRPIGSPPQSSGSAPARGTTIFNGTRLNSQSFERGAQWLIGLSQAEAAAGHYGKVGFVNIDLYAPYTGGPTWWGDVLLELAAGSESIVPRNGRKWTAAGTGTYTGTNGSGALVDAKVNTNGTSTVFGFHTSADSDWQLDKPLFAAVVYKSSKNLVLRLDTGFGAGNGKVLGVAPARSDISTFVTFGEKPVELASPVLTLYTNGDGTTGDVATLLRAGVISGRVFGPRSGGAAYVAMP